MASFSLNYTSDQQAALSYFLAQYNDNLAEQTPPGTPLTLVQFAQFTWDTTANDMVIRLQLTQRATIADAWRNASPALQAQIKTLLGVT